MAVTQNTYTGDGSTVLFSFTFPYLETTDIKVSLDGSTTTAYTLANATQIQFNTAPANGVAIRIYRQTDDADLAAQFYPGSAIRSQDLNDNFTQNLYVTQESNREAEIANTTADSAVVTANSAVTTANAATATANTASSNASAAVSTANTASSNASTALSTANTAISTANAASAAVAAAVIYQPVADLTALGALTPSDGDFLELQDSTGAESDPSITGITVGLVGSSGLTFRLRYDDPPGEYVFLGYFATDSETRYLKLAGGTMTGALGVTAGSAAAPGVFVSGDTNTGIYSPGADQIAISTGGTGRLFVDASGNVGIGTSAPGSLLQVNAATAVDTYIRTTNSNATGGFDFGLSSGGDAYLFNRNNKPLVFGTDSGEKARITSDGKLGLGTSSPGANLTVQGFSSYRGNTYTVASFAANSTLAPLNVIQGITGTHPTISAGQNSTGTWAPLAFATSDTFRMVIDSSGNVGIGTTNPAQTLRVTGTSGNAQFGAGTAGNAVFVNAFDSDTVYMTASVTNATQFGFGAASNIPLFFMTNNTERARIDTSGRLLVGTSSSRSLGAERILQIEGTSATTTSISAIRNSNDTSASVVALGKSRGTTNGSNTIVASDDFAGVLQFYGADGSAFIQAATIAALIDGTPGTNDMPGRLVFSVTADGASSPTEAMRIKNTRVINFSNAPVYADNAAAKTGGLVDGDVYRTSTGDLRIVYT